MYHTLYAPGTKFVKDPDFYGMFAQENAIFGMVSPAIHKLRKDLLSPLFSRRAVLGIEPLMKSKVRCSYQYDLRLLIILGRQILFPARTKKPERRSIESMFWVRVDGRRYYKRVLLREISREPRGARR